MPSSGIHANGFSLVRKIIEVAKTDLTQPVSGMAEPLGTLLMRPTRIYHKAAQTAHRIGGVTGICHVTGGGLVENPPVFTARTSRSSLIVTAGRCHHSSNGLPGPAMLNLFELARTFNCGIGMLLFIDETHADACLTALQQGPEPGAWVAGRLVERKPGAEPVSFNGIDTWSPLS